MNLADIYVDFVAEPGKQILQNATALSALMAIDATTISLAEECFSPDDLVFIEKEMIKINAETITRAQGGTEAAAHPSGANVRLVGGTTLLTVTFTGAEAFTTVRCAGDREAWFGIKINDDIVYVGKSDPYRNEWFYPLSQITPENGDVLTVVVWNYYETGMFWAEIHR